MLSCYLLRWNLMKMIANKLNKWNSDWWKFTTKKLIKEWSENNLLLVVNCLMLRNKLDWIKQEPRKKNKFTIWWKFLQGLVLLKNMSNLFKDLSRKNKLELKYNSLEILRRRDFKILWIWVLTFGYLKRKRKKLRKIHFIKVMIKNHY